MTVVFLLSKTGAMKERSGLLSCGRRVGSIGGYDGGCAAEAGECFRPKTWVAVVQRALVGDINKRRAAGSEDCEE
jgi:hypothetical protein